MARSRKGSTGSKKPRPSQSGAARVTHAPVVSNGAASPLGKQEALVAPSEGTAASTTQRRRLRPSVKRGLLIAAATLVLLLAGGGLWVWFSIQRTLPTITGTINMPGVVSAPVTVTRDAYGVPHIVAANRDDLYAAQGYIHAQDRLFQMFFFRAVGQGRLSEAFGERTVETDRFLRIVGFRRAAEEDMKLLTPEVRKGLEAYALGVNEFIRTHRDTLPLEFGLQGLQMEEWQPIDTLTFGKVQAWDLTQSWDDDLLRADLAAKVGQERAAQLMPEYPSEGPFIVADEGPGTKDDGQAVSDAYTAPHSGYSLLYTHYSSLIKPWLPSAGWEGLGSNNWVVDGTKSATGKPLLANDPHLGVRNPSIWYQNHLATSDGEYDATGFSFAGVPGIITGHNRDIAWGVTNTGADVLDLFTEKLDEAGHPGQYETADGWKPLTYVTETIRIKDGAPITQTVRITAHGPLLSDSFPVTPTIGTTFGKEPLAIQWTAHQGGRLFQAVYGLQTASNWEEFRAALANWDVPGQNFVYADREGNIGYQMTGNIPVRNKGDGKVPVPGSTGEYDWNGTVPFDDLPKLYNPPEHFIATANHKPFGPEYEYPISGDWASPWRISRITELLTAKDKVSADDFKAILMDTRSALAREVAPYLANLKPEDEAGKATVAMFKDWDGDLKADSVTAAIYEATVHSVLTHTFSDDLGRDLFINYLDVAGSDALRGMELMLDKPDDPFWDSADTPTKETRDDILAKSLATGISNLKGAIGENMQEWQWGKLHVIQPSHPFGAFFNLSALPLGGDGTTVSVAGFSLLEPFGIGHHQSYRMIVDTSDWSKSQAIYANGQSGQPFSKHFGDMLGPWQRGEFNPLLYTSQEIAASSEGVLTLAP